MKNASAIEQLVATCSSCGTRKADMLMEAARTELAGYTEIGPCGKHLKMFWVEPIGIRKCTYQNDITYMAHREDNTKTISPCCNDATHERANRNEARCEFHMYNEKAKGEWKPITSHCSICREIEQAETTFWERGRTDGHTACLCEITGDEHSGILTDGQIDELKGVLTRRDEEAVEAQQIILREGIQLVESAFAHVSHGGPTRADAEKWIKDAKEPKIVNVGDLHDGSTATTFPELIAAWREVADRAWGTPANDQTMSATFRSCADDLERLTSGERWMKPGEVEREVAGAYEAAARYCDERAKGWSTVFNCEHEQQEAAECAKGIRSLNASAAQSGKQRIREEALREAADVISQSRDLIGRIMHESWYQTKRAQGFHSTVGCPNGGGVTRNPCPKCHADLVDWSELSQAQKDINLNAFRDVIPVLEHAILKLIDKPGGR